MKKSRILLCLALLGLLTISFPVRADFRDNEPNLYGGGFPSADVLRPHEWVLAAPFGGWLGYGLADHWTVIWDYPAAFSGIVGALARYQLPGRSPITRYALEGYLTYYSKTYTDQRIDDYQVDHQGGQEWLHLIRTQRVTPHARLTIYAGTDYMNNQIYRPYKKEPFPESQFRHHWIPDAGIGWTWEAKPWMQLHLNALYGNSFLYSDLTAIKSMGVAAVQFAPFAEKRTFLLRNLRFEFNLLAVQVPPAHFGKILPFSPLPFVYWQWGGEEHSDSDVLHHI